MPSRVKAAYGAAEPLYARKWCRASFALNMRCAMAAWMALCSADRAVAVIQQHARRRQCPPSSFMQKISVWTSRPERPIGHMAYCANGGILITGFAIATSVPAGNQFFCSNRCISSSMDARQSNARSSTLRDACTGLSQASRAATAALYCCKAVCSSVVRRDTPPT